MTMMFSDDDNNFGDNDDNHGGGNGDRYGDGDGEGLRMGIV